MMKCPYTPQEMAARLVLFHEGTKPAIAALDAFEGSSCGREYPLTEVERAFQGEVRRNLQNFDWTKTCPWIQEVA